VTDQLNKISPQKSHGPNLGKERR